MWCIGFQVIQLTLGRRRGGGGGDGGGGGLYGCLYSCKWISRLSSATVASISMLLTVLIAGLLRAGIRRRRRLTHYSTTSGLSSSRTQWWCVAEEDCSYRPVRCTADCVRSSRGISGCLHWVSCQASWNYQTGICEFWRARTFWWLMFLFLSFLYKQNQPIRLCPRFYYQTTTSSSSSSTGLGYVTTSSMYRENNDSISFPAMGLAVKLTNVVSF